MEYQEILISPVCWCGQEKRTDYPICTSCYCTLLNCQRGKLNTALGDDRLSVYKSTVHSLKKVKERQEDKDAGFE